MSKFVLILFVLISACSFKTQKVNILPTCFTEFKNDAEEHWRYDSTKKCYQAEEEWIDKLCTYYEKCLKGCDTSLLLNTFGRQVYKIIHSKPLPNYPYTTAIQYRFDGSKEEGWILLDIVCDSLGKFVRFSGAERLKLQGAHGY